MSIKISIITPVLNAEKFIADCINSVISQDYSEWEHIIVDGGSTDNTISICQKIAAVEPRIKLLKNTSNQIEWVADSWNRGIQSSNGEYLGWLGADDMLANTSVLKIVSQFFTENLVDVAHGGALMVNEDEIELRRHIPKNFKTSELINRKNPVFLTSTYYSRKIVNEIGGICKSANDLDFMIRLRKKTDFAVIDEILSKFKIHSNSWSGSNKNFWIAVDDYKVSRHHGGCLFNNYFRAMLKYFLRNLISKVKLV